jgi:hypothetical protein
MTSATAALNTTLGLRPTRAKLFRKWLLSAKQKAFKGRSGTHREYQGIKDAVLVEDDQVNTLSGKDYSVCLHKQTRLRLILLQWHKNP